MGRERRRGGGVGGGRDRRGEAGRVDFCGLDSVGRGGEGRG